jgi:hypothetical protein
LDESYRKAGKMDAVNFSTNFNPNNTGIIENIREFLLKDRNSSTQVELHKLNVYGMQRTILQVHFKFGFAASLRLFLGPGSFFKFHDDTPKHHKYFGSLVVALPTEHEGGTFPLRHHGKEWVFNSADLVSPQNSKSPRAAFVAFSDYMEREREVTEIKSGYRVTLTYDLYFDCVIPAIAPATMLPVDDIEVKIRESLIELLNNPSFLPDGGLVGFGLSHLYPIDFDYKQGINLDEFGESLKGTDAAIKRACDSLSLDVSVKMVYQSEKTEGFACLLNQIGDPLDVHIGDSDIVMHLKRCSKGPALIVYDSDKLSLKEFEKEIDSPEDARPIWWLKPLTERNQIECRYLTYAFAVDSVYGEICLVLEVKASKNRSLCHYSEPESDRLCQ